MKEFITFLTACVVLGIAQSVTAALGMALLLFALMGAISHPRETFGFGFCLAVLVLALRAPAACAAALGAIGVAVTITSRVRHRRTRSTRAAPLLLPSAASTPPVWGRHRSD